MIALDRRKAVFNKSVNAGPLRVESWLLKCGDSELLITSCQITNSSVGSISLMGVKIDFLWALDVFL